MDNEPDGGDAECAHGLCYDFTCTRICAGPGANCDDVKAGFRCRQTTLYYGRTPPVEFAQFICVGP